MKNANDNFGSSNGSENFYCHRPSLMIYTDGVKALVEVCQAYWLIDLIISHHCKKEVNLERFQSWELRRVEGNTYFICATDGNRNRVARQKIPFSDFEYDAATIWLVDGCLMLPKEYYRTGPLMGPFFFFDGLYQTLILHFRPIARLSYYYLVLICNLRYTLTLYLTKMVRI